MNAKLLASLTASVLFAAPSASAQCWGETEVFATGWTNEERFGETVAIEGNRAVFGAPGAFIQFTQLGEAFVFERSSSGGADWMAAATLQPSDLQDVDEFGIDVALSGDTVAVGAHMLLGHGATFVFGRDQGGAAAWGQVKKLTHPNGKSSTYFGQLLALDGDTLVVAAPSDQGPANVFGKVWVYGRDQGGTDNWGLVTRLEPVPALGPFSTFGASVDVDGDRVVVGLGGNLLGEVAVFERDVGGVGAWGQVARVAPNPASGSFGTSVSLDGDDLAVGAWGENNLTGAAYLFERDQGGPGAWGQVARVEASDKAAGDRFGNSVSLDGDLLAAGAPFDDDAGLFGESGSLYVFARDLGGPSAWGELSKITAADAQGNDQFGTSVGLSATTVVTGSRHHDHPLPGQGAGYFYEANAVAPVSYCTAGPSASGCHATLSFVGTPSASSGGGFVVKATSVEGLKDGLFIFGTNGRQAVPWGTTGSFQCVVPPVKRAPFQQGNGTKGQCDGLFAQDLNAIWCPSCPKPGTNPGAGATLQVQFWYRDPQNPKNRTSSLSDAMEFCVTL